jgi:acyl-CoA dehydrogenase
MTEETDIIAQSIGRIFSENVTAQMLDEIQEGTWPSALWSVLEETGFTTILGQPDSDNEISWESAYSVFHTIGRYCAPVPLAETAIANGLCARYGLPSQAGPLSFCDAGQAKLDKDCLLFNTTVPAVPWASCAKALVVSALVEDRFALALIPASAPGFRLKMGANLAGEPFDGVRLSGCRSLAHVFINEPPNVAAWGALARSAMMAGAVQAALESSVSYAGERVQFGKPIGKFQAIQQLLAQLAGEASSAQCVALAAFSCAQKAPRILETAVAKIRTGKAAGLAAGIAHQVHGAIGFTWEHRLHHITTRLWSWRGEYGTEAWWAEWLGQMTISRGGSQMWPDLTKYFSHADILAA